MRPDTAAGVFLVGELGLDVGANAGHVEQAHAGLLAARAKQTALDLAVGQQVVGRAALDAELPFHIGNAAKLLVRLSEVARLDRGGGGF